MLHVRTQIGRVHSIFTFLKHNHTIPSDTQHSQNEIKNLQEHLNLISINDWNSLTKKKIKNYNGNLSLLKKYSLYEIKCMGYPEGKEIFKKPKKLRKFEIGYWENKENVKQFIQIELKEKFNLNTIHDWNKLTGKQIQNEKGGSSLLKKYSLYEIKCLGCPEGKDKFKKPKKSLGHWENIENVQNYLKELSNQLNLKTFHDWNKLTQKQIKDYENGGSLLCNYSLYELKCLGFPEGKKKFIKSNKKSNFWEKKENLQNFCDKLSEKLNLKTPDDWNKISFKDIQFYGGNKLLKIYSLYDIKLFACPEGKNIFTKSNKPIGYWENEKNIQIFLNELKEKLNLKTPENWNEITAKQIQIHGGSSLLNIYSLYEIKCLGCPEGKKNKLFSPLKPSGYWDKKENIQNFLIQLSNKLNLKNFKDWNQLTQKQIKNHGGGSLLSNYSLYDLKCLGFPEGKNKFSLPKKTSGYWEKKENVLLFLNELSLKMNLKTPDDWNSISNKDIQFYGGVKLLHEYSLFDLKCLACPEGKEVFYLPKKSSGYWDYEENVKEFLEKIKLELNLKTPEDWNSLSTKNIQSFGGRSLLNNYSLFDLKCLACPEGKMYFTSKKPPGFWDINDNIYKFLKECKEFYNLNTIEDWNRISYNQILSLGGWSLLAKYSKDEIIQKVKSYSLLHHSENSSNGNSLNSKLIGRSSQRWLFLQIQKLFPDEEIVEDYYHSEISRHTGFSVQFDVFLVDKKVAFEYHGKQHYEDIPSFFAPIEMYQFRDKEKEKLCKKFDISLIIVPYWWDNKIESLKKEINPYLPEKLKL